MNKDVRELFELLISILNQYDSVNMETKRLILIVILQMIEKKADESIMLEQEEQYGAAESLPPDKLGELSE